MIVSFFHNFIPIFVLSMTYPLKLTIRIVLFLLTAEVLFSSCSKEDSEDVTTQKPTSSFIISGYVPYWGVNQVNTQEFASMDLVNYFSIQPDSVGNFRITTKNQSDIKTLQSRLTSRTKLFITIGGWYESETIFPMAADASKRKNYIQNLLQFCINNQIQGIDLDWEDYPKLIDGSQYVTLVKDLSAELKPHGILLSIASGTGSTAAALTAQCVNYVDYINLMVYGELDAQGNHSTYTQLLDALSNLSTHGVSKSKIIAGVPFYAQRPSHSGDTSPLTVTYRSIVAQTTLSTSQTLYNSYSFNSRDLLQQKTHYLIENGYAGIFAWELSQDADFFSDYSLIRSIIQEKQKK